MTEKFAGLIQGQITDESVEMMRQRIGYPNPSLRGGLSVLPWNTVASADAIRRYAWSMGDDNPMYLDSDYGATTRWQGQIAPPGFEMSMGYNASRRVPEDLNKRTHRALRGVQLYHSGGEDVYYQPIRIGDTLFKAEWVEDVQPKVSKFSARSVVVTNSLGMWNQRNETVITGINWFVHAERRTVTKDPGKDKYAAETAASYTDEQIAEIDAAYDAEYRRGADTWFLEDISVGQKLPRMVKGPFTITDMINLHMGAGWLTYGNPAYRLAYENRKVLRGFYSKNANGAWDSVQRVHWDKDLANRVGVQHMYDIGPVRHSMLCHYLTNSAGDDAWIFRKRYEFRRFNYMGDTTWLQGVVTAVRVDEKLGPLVELEVAGVNQRGAENLHATVTILVASREHGPVRLPSPPPLPQYRSEEPIMKQSKASLSHPGAHSSPAR
jgi:acyl dehydratase